MKLKKLSSFLVVWILPAILYLVFSILSKGRLASVSMFLSIFQQSIYVAIISFAMYNVWAMGLWEMSSVSIFLLALIYAGNIAMNNQLGLIGMIGLLLIFNVAGCLLSCFMLRVTRLPSMILNFAMIMIFENVAAISYNGAFYAPQEWAFFNREPWCYILLVASFIALYILVNKTKFGYNVQAIGYGQKLAETVGINIRKNMYTAYLVEGILLVPAALINLSQSASANAIVALGTTDTSFDATVSCLIGRYLSKFCNPLVGTFIGAFSMKILTSGLLAIGLDSSWQKLAKGLFLILFLTFAQNFKRIGEARERRLKINEILGRMKEKAG